MRFWRLSSLAIVGVTSGVLLAQDGRSVFSDYRSDKPGRVHRITLKDLPAPYATKSVNNNAKLLPRPEGAMPQAPAGYSVSHYASGLDNPRLIRTAPNGDLFVAESRPGRVKVLRSAGGADKAEVTEVFATGLKRPFGIAFYPLGRQSAVGLRRQHRLHRAIPLPERRPQGARHPRRRSSRSCRAAGSCPAAVTGRATSRSRATASKMFVSVGSLTNVDDPDTRTRRRKTAPRSSSSIPTAPAGASTCPAFATRSASPCIHGPASCGRRSTSATVSATTSSPTTSRASSDGDFYGWPWFYMGGQLDPRHEGKRPELKDKVKTPDVLIQPHSASLQMVFYTAISSHRASRQRLRRAARLVEPRAAHRLQGDSRADQGRRPGDR